MAAPRTFIAGTLTAVAPLATVPTTTAAFSLFNGEAVGGKSYLITSVGFTTTTSAAATIVQQLMVHMSLGNTAILSGTAASSPRATDGLMAPSLAQCKSAVTIVVSSIWHPVGQALNSAALTATIGLGAWQNVRGLYTVPPGQVFSMHTIGSTAAGAAQLFVTWEEA